MKVKIFSATLALACSLFAGGLLAAPEYLLSDWKIGEIVAGDDLDLSALDGRVVAIEYWGPR